MKPIFTATFTATFTAMATAVATASAVAVLTLTGCSRPDVPASAEAPIAAGGAAFDLVAQKGKGFSVGAVMSAQTVYVLFDPQCSHCGQLWQASLPLHSKARWVWMPIAFNPAKSLEQAVALLRAADPLAAMTAHEQSLLAGRGGLTVDTASAGVAADTAQSVTANTQLLSQIGIDSVPYLLAKNPKSGQVVSHSGAMETADLARLLGMD